MCGHSVWLHWFAQAFQYYFLGRGQNLYLVNRMVHCAAEKSILLDVCGAQYIIPPRCSFLMSDMSTLQPLLHGMAFIYCHVKYVHSQFPSVVIDGKRRTV